MADLDAAEGTLATRGHRLLEWLHAISYFAPEVQQSLTAVGLPPTRMLYFAARAAPMGRVGAGVVTATFYHFNPELVGEHIPLAWTLADPAAIHAARLAGVDRAWRRLLGDEPTAGLVEAAELARRAIEGTPAQGRPIYAGYAELPWPAPAHLQLWHAATLLREHRGDGHVVALTSQQLNGLDATVSHTATGRGFLPEVARTRRGWSERQWAEAVDRLRGRGLLVADELALTEAGRRLRAEVEEQTVRLAEGPWQRLGDQAARLVEVLQPLARSVLANGGYPDGVFANPRA